MAVFTKQVTITCPIQNFAKSVPTIGEEEENIHETWVNIRNFYEKEIVSHEHPSV